MKISLNWLKEYINVDLSPEKIGEILTDIGLEVEGMDEIESIKGGLEGIVVGEVMECEKHPNADKLSLTKVNVNQEELLQIVCGAPNVAKGQKVLVATIGTTLYSPEGEAWKIKKGKIRGEESQGMICAEDELGLGDSHDGIMVLPESVSSGTLAKEYFKVESDYVYDIGLTPNRSDATSHMGVARDLAAALKINFDGSGKILSPSVSEFKVDHTDNKIEVRIEDDKACPRYTGISLRNIKIGQAPDWMKTRLQSIGVKSINVIVDITNFILHEMGQPLHAFDQDKIGGNGIIVKQLPNGSLFKTLDEKDVKLNQEDLMICDANSKPMCIAGVYGGIDSGVTDVTTSIFLEAAHFNPTSIRKTSTRHLLRTDAAKVFEKGSDPNLTMFALQRAALLMKELAGAEIASDIIDVYPNKITPKEILVKYQHVNRMMGIEIPKDELKAILAALKINVNSETEESFIAQIPTDKFDVIREADVIEEIIRIYGLNKIPIPSKINTSISTSKPMQSYKIKDQISSVLVGNGFSETMSVSLSKSAYYNDDLLPIAKEDLIFVNNTSNRDSDIMRPDMLMSILEVVQHNQNRQQADLKLFEFGSTYKNKGEEIVEERMLSLCVTGQQIGESWLNNSKNEVSFYSLKSYISLILQHFGINSFQNDAISNEIFTYGLKYYRGPLRIVEFGKIKSNIAKKMGIKNEVFYAKFFLDDIFKAIKKQKVKFVGISKFPGSRRDLALVLDQGINFSQIESIAKKTEKKYLKDINLFDVYSNEEQLGKGKKSYAVSFSFQNSERTMKDKEVDKIMNNLIGKYEAELGAKIRR